MAEQKQEAKEQSKTVKVKVLRPFLNNRTRMIEAKIGSVVEVNAEDVPELTKDFGGNLSFSGERYREDNDVARHKIVRAELVAQPSA